jgi:flavin-binding protein dodecin
MLAFAAVDPRKRIMPVAKVIELNSASSEGLEDAVRSGLRKCSETVSNITGATVAEIRVVTGADGSVSEWHVALRINYEV